FDFSKFLETWKPSNNNVYADIDFEDVDPHGLLLDMTDFHLDKLGLLGETVQDRVSMFHSFVNKLVTRATSFYDIEECVFIVGSDMLHTDTFFNTTTNGTPQDVAVDGYNAYSIAFEMYATVISEIRSKIPNVKVILIQGNHDRQKSYFIAHALSKYFEGHQGITFDITPVPRKVYLYGRTFIGMHHGNCKIDELPLVFAKEFSGEWGQCDYHEVLVGDKHFYYEKEIKGVRVKQLPALADTDRWHNDNNYVENIRAAVALIYHKEMGRVAEFEERLPKKRKK